jgi:hypothetical protein
VSVCDATYIRSQVHNGGRVMKRFLEWLDKLAMASPYAAYTLFTL